MSDDVAERTLDIANEKMTKESNDKEWAKVRKVGDEVDAKVAAANITADEWEPKDVPVEEEKPEDEVDYDDTVPAPSDSLETQLKAAGEKADEMDAIEARRNALKAGLISPPDLIKQDNPPKKAEKNNRDRTRKTHARTNSGRKGMTVAGATPKGSPVSYASSTREPNKRRGEYKIRPDEPINNVGNSTIQTGGNGK